MGESRLSKIAFAACGASLIFACAIGALWPVLAAQSLWGAVAFRHGAGLAWLRGKWQGLCGFSDARRGFQAFDPKLLEQFVRENERTILEFQKAAGFDAYWKLYFLLTGGGAK